MLLLSSPGCNVSNVFRLLKEQIVELQRGKLFDLGHGEKVFVIASIHIILADTPQAADMAGCKRHMAKVPCHRCNAVKDDVISLGLQMLITTQANGSFTF
jgi:hypothetical protein